MTSDEETLWALRAQCGDREALEHLLRSVQPTLHRYVRRLVGAADADDVVQDVLVSIARNVVWLVEPRLFRPWAYRIASRASFSHLRRVRRRGVEETDGTVLAALPGPDAPPDNELLAELLDGDVLSPASRECQSKMDPAGDRGNVLLRRSPAVHVVHDGHSVFAATGPETTGSAAQGATVDAPTGGPSIAINRLMPLKILWVSSAIQLFFVACATAVLMLHVSRMTRAILRAIESSRR